MVTKMRGCLCPIGRNDRITLGLIHGTDLAKHRGVRMEERAVGRRRGEAGFTLIELIIVVAIIGMLALILTMSVSRTLKRQRLETAAHELSSFLENAYVRGQTLGTSVFVTAVKNADNSATFRIVADSNNNNQLDSTDQVLSTQLVPNDIAVSGISTVPASFGSNTWPKSGSTWMLFCDTLGRTMDPTVNPPAQVAGMQTLSITHQEMLSGSLAPKLRYDLTDGPIWHFNTNKARF
jgi:prepilin-type N-terminal cleavage/methylation domain-containing protein